MWQNPETKAENVANIKVTISGKRKSNSVEFIHICSGSNVCRYMPTPVELFFTTVWHSNQHGVMVTQAFPEFRPFFLCLFFFLTTAFLFISYFRSNICTFLASSDWGQQSILPFFSLSHPIRLLWYLRLHIETNTLDHVLPESRGDYVCTGILSIVTAAHSGQFI